MEQSVNTFSKGLQTDINPMLQGKESLSNALNATLITQDGDELILQNDMGNARVNRAFLPPGYEPVGIKEYGGIIYIASYNPTTGKSQLGSFPSPQKYINVNDSDFINSDDIFTFSSYEYRGINFLKDDSKIIQLSKEKIHVGDKFVVTDSNIWEKQEQISNFNNVLPQGNKVISPKNKKYTLDLGVINSQNQFVPITKDLVRWNDNDEIINTKDKSNQYKYNVGYFIKKSNLSDWSANQVDTIADSQLLRERNNKPTNTYINKLIGPLCIKSTLNHAQNLQYNISGLKIFDDENNQSGIKIIVRAKIIYNCEDGCNVGGKGNDIYNSFAQGVIDSDKIGFDLYYFKSDYYDQIEDATQVIPGRQAPKIGDLEPTINDHSFIINSGGEYVSLENKSSLINTPICEYDESSNIYSVVIEKMYSLDIKRDTIINYFICTKSPEQNIYLRNLSHEGRLDTSLFGKDITFLKSWQWLWNDSTKRISINFENYSETLKEIKITVFDTSYKTKEPLVGEFIYEYVSQDLEITQFSKLLNDRIYLFQIDGGYLENEQTVYREISKKWIITSSLFDEFYESQAIINNDMCDPKFDPDDTTGASSSYYNKFKIQIGEMDFDVHGVITESLKDVYWSNEATSEYGLDINYIIHEQVISTDVTNIQGIENYKFILPHAQDVRIKTSSGILHTIQNCTYQVTGFKNIEDLDLIKNENIYIGYDHDTDKNIILYDGDNKIKEEINVGTGGVKIVEISNILNDKYTNKFSILGGQKQTSQCGNGDRHAYVSYLSLPLFIQAVPKAYIKDLVSFNSAVYFAYVNTLNGWVVLFDSNKITLNKLINKRNVKVIDQPVYIVDNMEIDAIELNLENNLIDNLNITYSCYSETYQDPKYNLPQFELSTENTTFKLKMTLQGSPAGYYNMYINKCKEYALENNMDLGVTSDDYLGVYQNNNQWKSYEIVRRNNPNDIMKLNCVEAIGINNKINFDQINKTLPVRPNNDYLVHNGFWHQRFNCTNFNIGALIFNSMDATNKSGDTLGQGLSTDQTKQIAKSYTNQIVGHTPQDRETYYIDIPIYKLNT